MYCGNFGLFLLNAAWCFANGEASVRFAREDDQRDDDERRAIGRIVTFEEEKEKGTCEGEKSSGEHEENRFEQAFAFEDGTGE